MSINLEFLDITSLSVVQNAISEISDIPFSTYDSSGVLLIPSKGEDKLTVQIKSYASGREEYGKFIRSGIEKASTRKEASLLKGPANQHHLFIPVTVNNYRFVLVSNAFYFVRTEFEDFLIKKGEHFGLSISHLESWSGIIKIKDYSSIQKIADHIKSLFETALRCNYERNLNYKRYQWTKTLMDIIFDIQLPTPIDGVYSLVADAILFLFNVDTVSIMVKEKGFFKTVKASGRLKDDVRSICMEENNPLVSRSIKGLAPTSTNDIVEITRLGFPESINSVHIFPLSCSSCTYGVVIIYNSILSREESYSILEFCKLACLVLKNLLLHDSYDKCIKDMAVLNTAAAKLTPHLHNPSDLHETIVDTAAGLLKAERGSLMLPEEDNLLIKAVKGINRWLIQDIKIKIGEGVAGKVFKNGEPLLVKDVERTELPYIKPKRHYKTGSFVSVPLKFTSETVGVINISDKITGDEFTEQDLNLLNYFSSYASIALNVSCCYILAEQMKELSITDPLTGLFNRRYLQERFAEELHRSERYNFVFSLALFDIDYFKLFNDTEGHLAGDSALKHIARIAHECLRANDVIARFGGEEFIVLMPQTDKEKAFIVAERIRENIRESLTRKWEKFPHPHITVSMGIASFHDDGKTVNELIKSADTALYRAKATGRDRTVIYKIED